MSIFEKWEMTSLKSEAYKPKNSAETSTFAALDVIQSTDTMANSLKKMTKDQKNEFATNLKSSIETSMKSSKYNKEKLQAWFEANCDGPTLTSLGKKNVGKVAAPFILILITLSIFSYCIGTDEQKAIIEMSFFWYLVIFCTFTSWTKEDPKKIGIWTSLAMLSGTIGVGVNFVLFFLN